MASTILLRETKDGVFFDIHVNPRASRAQIAGIAEGLLKIKVNAPPVEGAANKACLELLSRKLEIRKSQLSICAGAKGRKKTILASGIGKEDLEKKLSQLESVSV